MTHLFSCFGVKVRVAYALQENILGIQAELALVREELTLPV